jgi:L-ascorbate metabolism protein UlaG (beta-lactamase superfamily)
MVLVRLINHACFSIERKDSLTLMDPWFSGRIFNKSWSLIRETDLQSISGIEKLKI